MYTLYILASCVVAKDWNVFFNLMCKRRKYCEHNVIIHIGMAKMAFNINRRFITVVFDSY